MEISYIVAIIELPVFVNNKNSPIQYFKAKSTNTGNLIPVLNQGIHTYSMEREGKKKPRAPAINLHGGQK